MCVRTRVQAGWHAPISVPPSVRRTDIEYENDKEHNVRAIPTILRGYFCTGPYDVRPGVVTDTVHPVQVPLLGRFHVGHSLVVLDNLLSLL